MTDGDYIRAVHSALGIDEKTDLDERTKKELQPPCETFTIRSLAGIVLWVSEQCSCPAKWIMRTSCHCGTHDLALICTKHKDEAVAGMNGCNGCRCKLTAAELAFEELK